MFKYFVAHRVPAYFPSFSNERFAPFEIGNCYQIAPCRYHTREDDHLIIISNE